MSTTVLAGGHVIDPASGRNEVTDITVKDGVITAIGPAQLSPEESAAADIRNCSGEYVVPGLIDLHTHVFPGLGDFCVPPDRAGVSCGVPTVVDAGTTGTATFGIAHAALGMARNATRVLMLIDPCRLYLATKDFLPHRLHLADNPANLDLEGAAAILEQHSDVVVGFKARACTVDDPHRSPFLEGAVSIAGDRPVMVHLGAFPYTPSLSTEDTLRTLRPGDVVTHAFRGHSGVVDRQGQILPVFADRVSAGLFLDLGHSGSDFRFAAARQLFELGYLPDTLSTDLNLFNEDAPVHSLVEVMSKMLALGVPLESVIAMVTSNPAKVLRRSDVLGSLAVGRQADVSVLKLEDGAFALSDGFETVRTDRRLAPVGCLRAGQWHDAQPHAVSRPDTPVAA